MYNTRSTIQDQTTSPIILPWQSPVYWVPELKVRAAQSNIIVINGLCSINFSNPFLNTFTLLLHMIFCSSNIAVIKHFTTDRQKKEKFSFVCCEDSNLSSQISLEKSMLRVLKDPIMPHHHLTFTSHSAVNVCSYQKQKMFSSANLCCVHYHHSNWQIQTIFQHTKYFLFWRQCMQIKLQNYNKNLFRVFL